jgi:MoxR-like ATPase
MSMEEQNSARATGELMQRVLYEVKRVVVGQDHFLERVLVAILAQGHRFVGAAPHQVEATVDAIQAIVRRNRKAAAYEPGALL